MNNNIRNINNYSANILSKRIEKERELCRQTQDVLRTLSSSNKALAKELSIQFRALSETQKFFENDLNQRNGGDEVDADQIQAMQTRDFLYDQMYPIKESNIKLKNKLRSQISLAERIRCYENLRRNKQKLSLLKDLISENCSDFIMDFSRFASSEETKTKTTVYIRILGCDQISRSFSLNSILTGLPTIVKNPIKSGRSIDTGENINAKVRCDLLIGGKVIFSTIPCKPSPHCWNAVFEYKLDPRNPLEVQVIWLAPYQQLTNIIKTNVAHYESLNFVLSALAYVPLSESEDCGFKNRVINLSPEGRVFLETDIRVPTVTRQLYSSLPRQALRASLQPARNSPIESSSPIPGFTMVALLGTGHFGKIILSQKMSDRRYYAIKVIKKRQIVDSDEYEQIIAEKTVLEVIKSKNHPLLVHLYSCIQDSGHIMFVLEFVQAGDLITLINSMDIFSHGQALFYIASVVLCFEFLHRNNIMYRDLKMENLLLDSQGYVKLVDFGLCKLNMNKDGYTHTLCGTIDYMAPEVFSGHGYSRMVDWWTVGVLLYYMLVGDVPFQADTESESVGNILHKHVTIPVPMDAITSSFIISLLNRNPKSRLGSRNGATEVKIHPYFANIDFDRVLKRKMKAPFIPDLKHDHDLVYFDRQFTTTKPTLSVCSVDLSKNPDAKQFFDEFV